MLHGPQGALYGKSTTGGAINLIPNRPAFERSADFSLTAATPEMYRANGALGGTLVEDDVIAGRMAFSHEDFGGFYKNSFLREPLDDNQQSAARAALLWQPAASIEVRPTVYFRDQAQHGFLRCTRDRSARFQPRPVFAQRVERFHDGCDWR